MSIATAHPHQQRDERSFLLQRAQPAMTGLIDGSLSTLALELMTLTQRSLRAIGAS